MDIAQNAEVLCMQCGSVFSADSPWASAFCSAACKQLRKAAQNRTRVRSALTPSQILEIRERSQAWSAKYRSCKRPNSWLSGPPPYEKHLPGVTTAFSILPTPTWPIELRNTRALHGALTGILGVNHIPRFPLFSLRQSDLSPSGWAVHWWHESGLTLALKSFETQLYNKPSEFTFGPLIKIRAPIITRRGRRRLRIDTITPVCLVNSRNPSHRPTAENLLSTLSGEQLSQFGIEYLRHKNAVRLEVVSSKHEQDARVELGGKYGTVLGWEGSIVVETNASGHWLLETASRVGLGARTAFGFGQIRVSTV